MGNQIRFFEKSKCDYSNPAVVLTASQGNDYIGRIIDRSNSTSWMTTSSVDADNTTILVEFGDYKTIDSIALLKHNFKSYKIEYWDGSAYQPMPGTAIDETVNTAENKFHQFTAVETIKILLTIRGTMVANEDKYLFQLLATQQIGQFNGWPQIKKATLSRNRIRIKMISGKESIREQIGSFQCSLSLTVTSDSGDLDLIENLHAQNDGFLMWIAGGSETQFSSVRKGYRLEDWYLMKCASELVNDFYQGIYANGVVVKFDLTEVVD